MSLDPEMAPKHERLDLVPAAASEHVAPPGLNEIVRSAAYASDCPFGAFVRGPSGKRVVESAFGFADQNPAPGLERFLDEVFEPWGQRLLVVNDLAVCFGPNGPVEGTIGDTLVRFVAVVRVTDGADAILGALIVGDDIPHAGLSAAQVYVLTTHAAQVSAVLELDGLRRTSNARATAARWSDAERLRLLESVVVNANDAVLITDAEPIDLPGPRIVYCNAAFERTTGYSEAEVLGRTPRILQSDKVNRGSLDRLKTALREWRPVEVELLNQRKDGTEFWVELSIVPVANEKGWFTHWVSVQRDVTDRKRNEEIAVRARVAEAENLALESEIEERKRVAAQLLYQAYHDDLTKLHNRAFFMERLELALHHAADRPGTSCTVLFLDLNRFKLVNDSLGHRVGDLLLMETAQRLRACIRPHDTLARIGGDEFAILIEDTMDMTAGIAAAERVIDALQPSVRVGSQEIFSPASVGIAQSSNLCSRPEDLLRNADIAMYQAKNSGTTGFAVFTGSMHAEAVEALETQTDLRNAVVREEFHLNFQPIYDPRSKLITGMEALVRWQHPNRGPVGPGTFIPLAEEIGLIRQIGAWVLREACTNMRRWTDIYPKLSLRMSVNASGEELRDPGYVSGLLAVLAATGLDPGKLQIEITESVFMSGSGAVGDTLEAISAIGVRIALDDFGTGFSSLSYLDRYPIDTIKIDRSFVVKMLTKRRTLAIVETIIGLGRTLDLDIVAEGVEEEEQLETLLALKCNSVQGFLLGRPMPRSDMDALLLSVGNHRPVVATLMKPSDASTSLYSSTEQTSRFSARAAGHAG